MKVRNRFGSAEDLLKRAGEQLPEQFVVSFGGIGGMPTSTTEQSEGKSVRDVLHDFLTPANLPNELSGFWQEGITLTHLLDVGKAVDWGGEVGDDVGVIEGEEE